MGLHMCKLVAVENKMAGRKALRSKLFPNDPFLSGLPYLLAYCSTEEEGKEGKGRRRGGEGRGGEESRGWW